MAESAKSGKNPIVVQSPPARLHAALDSSVSSRGYDGEPTGQVLARAMHRLPVELKASWSAAHADLVELLASAQEFVAARTISYDGSPHSKTFQALSGHICAMEMHPMWSAYRPTLEPLISIALPFSVHHVAPGAADISVSREDAADVLQQLDELIVNVKAADYPTELRQEVLRTLLTLRDRINRFEILGPEGVKEATTMVFGTLVLNKPTNAGHAKIIRDAADLLTKVADVFLKYYAVGQLAAGAMGQLLLPGLPQ